MAVHDRTRLTDAVAQKHLVTYWLQGAFVLLIVFINDFKDKSRYFIFIDSYYVYFKIEALLMFFNDIIFYKRKEKYFFF